MKQNKSKTDSNNQSRTNFPSTIKSQINSDGSIYHHSLFPPKSHHRTNYGNADLSNVLALDNSTADLGNVHMLDQGPKGSNSYQTKLHNTVTLSDSVMKSKDITCESHDSGNYLKSKDNESFKRVFF